MTSREQADRESALTDRVVQSFAGTESTRLKQVMESLVRHLHAFAATCGSARRNGGRRLDFLTACGTSPDDRRQEFVLLSDVLGL